MYFRIIAKGGHCGAGNYKERVLYIEASSYFEAMQKAINFPSIKHKAKNIEKIEEISKTQYMKKMYWINKKKEGVK